MYERFTDPARKVMRLATSEATRFQYGHIGSAHILLELLRAGTFVAVTVLKNLHADVNTIRLELEKVVAKESAGDVATKWPALAPRAKAVIEFAIDEARRFNHDYVGTEHLLLGLLRDEEGIGAKVLMNRGLTLDKVRAEILNVLGPSISG